MASFRTDVCTRQTFIEHVIFSGSVSRAAHVYTSPLLLRRQLQKRTPFVLSDGVQADNRFLKPLFGGSTQASVNGDEGVMWTIVSGAGMMPTWTRHPAYELSRPAVHVQDRHACRIPSMDTCVRISETHLQQMKR